MKMKEGECWTSKTMGVEGKRNKDNVINQTEGPKGEKSSTEERQKQKTNRQHKIRW